MNIELNPISREQAAKDLRDMLPFVRAALAKVASGDAVGLPLRTMALRALNGQDVRHVSLDTRKAEVKGVYPSYDELGQLDRMHARAVLRLRRH
ncbi:hypothetical protein [Paraburkholderia hospita]|uniref:Uncharacterized protein n=1 Tax=Paraburkholderia hospita TaxID=169430 RepID=A0AAN1JHI1_9BURK|nr:hypothetical protein [Paraburkholderia hospita]AUT74052.1 hypothetical protein C2L64_37785 [Paraburkholderia hospita]EIN02962.1 hypothetical protein WQE_01030 [Paraburkholderia hospita]OUL78678.1 hypothetical protein CA602_31030 [Paraburkholderia hospita]OUL85883.1 hypothetical protein CA601_23025 [Paraburkholderia hospita]SEH45328.1 hypothetical protein SAMN05192544_100231 [Paraburkholderia hospita]